MAEFLKYGGAVLLAAVLLVGRGGQPSLGSR